MALYTEPVSPHQAIYPDEGLVVPSFTKFGTWIGGDRDGNPFGTVLNIIALLHMRFFGLKGDDSCQGRSETSLAATSIA